MSEISGATALGVEDAAREPCARGKRSGRRPLLAIAAAGIALVLTFTFAIWIVGLGRAPLGEGIEFSKLVVDREGRLLRPYATSDGRWRLRTAIESVDPRYVAALIAYEDKRFRAHHGVDVVAIARAALQLVRNRRIISGASTLTMQVVRLLEPRRERTLAVKLREMARALELERKLSKDEILSLYLNLAPFGGNIEGVRAAALTYFGKEPRRLTLGEVALLVALPQAPELRRPDRVVGATHQARDRVLDRIAAAGLVPADEVESARHEAVPAARRPMPTLSPHAADEAIATAPQNELHRLTIDATLQKGLEELARDRARAFGPDVSVAEIVIDNASGEVLARVGSAGYFDKRRSGQIDMTTAWRSPGSALKPFIYGLAFEDGVIHPETLIEDRPVRYGSYAPENFDLTFQGTVTVRRALQLSLNVPAVKVLDAVGASRLFARLATGGALLTLPKGEVPGLAMGLGGVGIRLSDLTMLYAGLARLGTVVPLIDRHEATPAPVPRRLLDPVAAWYVGNVLIGTPPPENAVGGRIAFKTGTSYGYRDAWALGFDGKRTVGVWVGRPDGAPVPGLTGRTAAAPILFDTFARMNRAIAPLPAAPKGVLVAAAGKIPPPLRHFRAGGVATQPAADSGLRIMFPPDGARLEFAGVDGSHDPIGLKIAGGAAPLTVLVNGIPAAKGLATRTLFWEPDGPGFVRLTVIDARGAADSVAVRVE
jgi:penicillin-binding protein 1C